jgi:hypothetical protein
MSTSKRIWTAGFYWTGVIMTVACFALVFAENTNVILPIEHAAFPLSWAFGGIAVLAFLAAEFCHSFLLAGRANDQDSELFPELERVDF